MNKPVTNPLSTFILTELDGEEGVMLEYSSEGQTVKVFYTDPTVIFTDKVGLEYAHKVQLYLEEHGFDATLKYVNALATEYNNPEITAEDLDKLLEGDNG